MVVRRKKKVRRQRGSRSHGYGVIRDHKGSGIRGGVGNAGTNTHRYIQIVKLEKKTGKKIIGKYGFKRPQNRVKDVETINVSHLDQSIDTMVEQGEASIDGNDYAVNLDELGYEKLLAQGNVHRKMNITVKKATSRAISKIKDAGGSVQLLKEE